MHNTNPKPHARQGDDGSWAPAYKTHGQNVEQFNTATIQV